ncbi:MAG: hypothetical protein ACLU5B_16080 [Mediterraneibacter faecis]
MSQDIINNRFLEESVFAIADGYCVINLTKNIVRGSMYQVVNGKKYNLNEQLGLPENSSLQSLVDAWALTIPEEGLKDFLHEFDRERLLKRLQMVNVIYRSDTGPGLLLLSLCLQKITWLCIGKKRPEMSLQSIMFLTVQNITA